MQAHTHVSGFRSQRTTSGVISQVLPSDSLRWTFFITLICLEPVKEASLASSRHCLPVCFACWEYEHTLHLPFLLSSGMSQVSCGGISMLPVGLSDTTPPLFMSYVT